MHTSTEMMYQRKYSRVSITMYLHADRSVDPEMKLQGLEGVQSIRDQICGARFVEVRGPSLAPKAGVFIRIDYLENYHGRYGGYSDAWLLV